MKLPVSGTEGCEGNSLEVDSEKETITLLDGHDTLVGTVTWEQIVDFVQASQEKTLAKNARTHARARLAIKVHYQTPEGKQFESLTSGIGAGGLFIETSVPLPRGADIGVEFLLPDNPWERIKANAKVAWIRRKTERYVLPPGMGLMFTDITAEDRRKIEELVKALNRARER